jgi:hypothetical protein
MSTTMVILFTGIFEKTLVNFGFFNKKTRHLAGSFLISILNLYELFSLRG